MRAEGRLVGESKLANVAGMRQPLVDAHLMSTQRRVIGEACCASVARKRLLASVSEHVTISVEAVGEGACANGARERRRRSHAQVDALNVTLEQTRVVENACAVLAVKWRHVKVVPPDHVVAQVLLLKETRAADVTHEAAQFWEVAHPVRAKFVRVATNLAANLAAQLPLPPDAANKKHNHALSVTYGSSNPSSFNWLI